MYYDRCEKLREKGDFMKRLIAASLIGAMLLSGCGTLSKPHSQAVDEDSTVLAEDINFFPMTDEAFVGDTMPFFENGKMNVFYLADMRDDKAGYHPWALMQTEDYCTYEKQGEVIPYSTQVDGQDLALGTGCVMKDNNGLYHAFYTGHNDRRMPKEAIMHATSTDMLNWTKVPEDTFIANEKYSLEDFRDPYVFYVEEEQCYWMLVVTRYQQNGVIVKYTSKDLSKWTDQGVLFTDDMGYGTNLECPSLLQYNGVWYLAFSDQWPNRLVHYRVGKSINGPFTALEKDTLDGNGFYAGRMETDGENLYMVGWNPTKVGHEDTNEYNWGGSMVIHQLRQHEDGTLTPIVNESIVERVSHGSTPAPILISETVHQDKNSYTMSGEQFELVEFDYLPDYYRIEADIKDFAAGGKFGFGFAPNDENVGSLNFLFNVDNNTVEFYNTDGMVTEDPQSTAPFDFSGKDSVHVTILGTDNVLCMYVDGEIALTARMYRAVYNNWELFSIQSGVTWENLEIFN